MNLWRCIAASIALLVVGFARAGAPSPIDAAGAFASANEAYRSGVAAESEDPDGAADSFRRAAALYQSILDAGVENGRVHYNLANALLRSGGLGRAILHYRRADRLMPGNADIQTNLAAARDRTEDRIPASTRRAAARTLLFWHYDVPPRARWWVFVVAFNAFWIGLAARFLNRSTPWWALALCGAVALALGGSLAADALGVGRSRDGVVLAGEVVGRKGPDERGYEPSFTTPLHAGAEFTVIETRDAWMRVRLADDRETWLPRSAVELVEPPASARSSSSRD